MAALEEAAAGGRTGLLRVLGVVFGVAVTVGGVIGMGILRTPGEVARQLPSESLFVGAWALGGLYALLGTLSVAELGTAWPRSGGFYVFVRRALGEYPAFVVGWSDWLSTCGTIAAVALVAGEYAGKLAVAFKGKETAVAASVVLFFALLQWRGVRWGSRSQELTSLIKTLAFLALTWACFAYGGGAAGAPPRFYVTEENTTVLLLLASLLRAMQGIIYTYDGWYNAIYFGEEVREPERNVPRAMIGSVLLVIVIYLLFNVALLRVLGIEGMAGESLAAGAAAGRVFGERGGAIIGWVALVSLLAAVNAFTLIAPRIIYAMSRDRLVWRGASRVNRGGTPTSALAMSTAAAVLMIVFSRAFEQLLAALAFFFVTNYAAAFLSVFVLRRREPDAPRPYRAWGYPWTTGLVLAASVAFLAGAVAADTANSLYALGLLALSLPAYLVAGRARTT
ncbi:MAG TPA: APC family permease [Pyrinomonadaceae bacterium]|nr:APC family permease [Pyrinomonadaceae bacterium]